eukprot:gene10222-2642_t
MNDFEEDLKENMQECIELTPKNSEEEIKLLDDLIPSRKVSKSLSNYLLVDKDKAKFKMYVKESQQMEKFNFYTMYKSFINQKNKDEKNKIRKQIFKEFIDENAPNKITIDHKKRNKVIKKFKNGEENPYKFIFMEVYASLAGTYKTYYRQYKHQSLEESEQQLEIEKQQKIKFPQNFDELIESKGAMQLFSTFVQENFGQNYIECYEALLEYNESKEETKDAKLILPYLKLSSSKNILKNYQIREEIILKEKLKKDWDKKLYRFLYNVLNAEFYSRFINSHTWKNYIKINDLDKEQQQNPDFEDVYTVQNIDKSVDSFSETIEILIVKNKSTSEQFKAIKIVSTKKNIEEKRIKALNQINHENIIQLIDLFYEDLSKTNKGCLTMVTTYYNESLDKYLINTAEPFSRLELFDMMIQMLSGLQQFHKLNRHFEIGELTEKRIYFTGLYSNLNIDPGFFLEDFDYMNYFEPPEKQSSFKSDIFAMGMIFFRLLTLLSPKIIAEIVNRKTTDNKILHMIRVTQPDYYYNIRQFLQESKNKYEDELINLILSMIDSRPEQRKDVDSLIEKIGQMRSNLNKFISRRSRKKKGSKFEKLEKAEIKIMEDDELRQYFKAYMRTEYAVEPILFYEDVRVFQHFLSDQDRYYKAVEICESYLRSTSDLEINVSGKLKKILAQELKLSKETGNVNTDIFDEMVKHICDTLLIDTFPRFHVSKIYEELQETIKEK